MSAPETLDPQFQIDNMSAILNDRLTAAVPVETLSKHTDRILQVFEEPDGSRFVRRDFTDEAVRHVEEHPLLKIQERISFREAWEATEDLYAAAGIQMVPSFMVEQEGTEHPYAIISEHLTGGLVDIKDVPTEHKVELVKGMGKLLKPEAEYWPSLEAIFADTFKGVRQEDGSHKVLMVDTDPFVIPAPTFARDNFLGEYIKRFSEILWDDWCDEDRAEVATALVVSLADSLTEEEYGGMDNLASRAFMNLHLMSNGMDPRGTGVDLLA